MICAKSVKIGPVALANCRQRDGRTEKLTWSLSSGELKLQKWFGVIKKISSAEPLDQYLHDFAQIILWENEFKFVQMKGIAPLQGEIIAKE
jgi:hypothetical protein